MVRITNAFNPDRDSGDNEKVSGDSMPTNVEENAGANEEITELKAKVANLTRILDDAAAPAQTLGKLWMLPGVVGVFIVMMGLFALFLAFTQIDTARFDDALWGGVVLVAIGAFSSTATALIVKPSASASAGTWAALSEDLSEESQRKFPRGRSVPNSKHQRS